MLTDVEEVKVWKLPGETNLRVDDVVARESPLTIILNDRELVTLLCSPTCLGDLAVGFLFSEGLISVRNDIKKIVVDEIRGIARVETTIDSGDTESVFKRFISSGCGRGASFYNSADAIGMVKDESPLRVTPSEITALFKDFQHRSSLYRRTGGVHSAAMCNSREIVLFAEDVGRHNAVDKIFGKCLVDDVSTEGLFVLTSGRISSEILLKVARRRIPLLASKSAPTDAGVRLAADLGVTLVGFVRGSRMNVYANEWRLQ